MFRWTRFDKSATMLHTLLMTFAHLADLQLGCNRFDGRLSRRREQDFYDSWQDMATRLAARRDVSHVILAGDIFEYASPSTAARYAFQVGLRTLRQAEKKVLVVSGNHGTPRAAETMHALIPYHDPDWCFVAHDESWSVDRFRLVPWEWGKPIDARRDLEPGSDRVLVVHAACPVLEEYSREGTRDYLPEMGAGYQYVALGDYHVPTQVAPNSWYSGSLEHTSFGESDAPCGGWIVTLDDNWRPGLKGYTQEWIEAKTRRMVNHHVADEHEANLLRIQGYAEKDPESMYRVIVHGIEPTQIDPHLLDSLKSAGHFVKVVFQDRPAPPDMVDFGPQTLLDQWDKFMDSAEYGPEVAQVGIDILEEAIANG